MGIMSMPAFFKMSPADFKEAKHLGDLFKGAGASRQDAHDIMKEAKQDGVSREQITKALEDGASIDDIKSALHDRTSAQKKDDLSAIRGESRDIA